ncbi:MAG: SIMPL domain-containing protein [Lentisphaerae bacterium]|jgi:uncharacterized protein YggE|nr:SIMPL domain-containing protein [Lentisphaerota bacterium]MBT4819459.1 SIMPL domain-containing protein [Lentisphaerota bacterium]MBT5612062.1 SIMPL domain-containing protein [Lentisphaerota bacterium]MBT7056896.1 SIMPL domain-containing protein [Lentisphaerota bacterium]MBT7842053.1 SIMPL domain-containing protein [Lentisphaerota bacterium]
MVRRCVVIALSVVMTGTVLGEPELSGTADELRRLLDPPPGQVTISGFSERTVEADRAVVRVSILTLGKRLKVAMEENRQVRSKMISKLVEGGIPLDRTHTSRFASTPLHSAWTGKVKEYQIVSKVRIHAESEDDIHLIAGLVDTFDEVSLASMAFEMTKREEIITELLKDAFRRVQQRRELYESCLGVTLSPRHVNEPTTNDVKPRLQFPMSVRVGSVSGVLSDLDLDVSVHALAQQEEGIDQFEELLYKVGIAVTFDLTPVRVEEAEPGSDGPR